MARTNKPMQEFWIQINLSGPRYWKVSANSIQVVEPPGPNEGPVISFGEFDFRGFFENGASRSTAKKFFLREFSEKCRLLYAGAKKPIYATPTHRLSEFEHALYPGAWYLDQLVQKDNLDYKEKDRIVGFSLEAGSEEEGNLSKILVLYAWRTDGSMSAPEITLNPHDIELVISEFAKANDVNIDEVLLYPTEDILALGTGVPYPPEEDISGIPYSKIYQSFAAIFGVAFIGLTSINGWNYMQVESLKEDAGKIRQQISKVKADQSKVVSKHLYAFADQTGIQAQTLFVAAEMLYAPQVDIDVISADLKDGPNGMALVHFNTHEELTKERVPLEVLQYLTLKKEYVDSNRLFMRYNNSRKNYEASYSFKAVDAAFDGFVRR